MQHVITDHEATTVGVAVPGPIYALSIVSPEEPPSPNIRWQDKPLRANLNDVIITQVYVRRDVFCAAPL